MTSAEFKELRRATGLSQEAVAWTILGVTARTVARWESGKGRIKPLQADEIRRRLRAASKKGEAAAKRV